MDKILIKYSNGETVTTEGEYEALKNSCNNMSGKGWLITDDCLINMDHIIYIQLIK